MQRRERAGNEDLYIVKYEMQGLNYASTPFDSHKDYLTRRLGDGICTGAKKLKTGGGDDYN